MLTSTIDPVTFERIKCEQSLNVTYDGFVEHFTKILDACKRSELHLSLVGDESSGRKLQFYEKRSFRNLVHLAVPIAEPPVHFVLYYINAALTTTQQQANASAQQANKLMRELDHRDTQIGDLKAELKMLANKVAEKENLVFTRNTDQANRLQMELKHLTDAKEADARKFGHTIKTLQDTVDYLTKENFNCVDRCGQETKKLDAAREELRQLKVATKTARDETERLRADVIAHTNRDLKTEHLMAELRKQLADQQDRLQAVDKQRQEWAAELEAEKQIARTKRTALELATDEINKANSIIVKQAKEVGQLRSKVELRTEVALQQERRVKELESMNERLRQTNVVAEQTAGQTENVAQHLQDLRTATDDIHKKYTRSMSCFIKNILLKINLFFLEIHDLKTQLQQISAESKLTSSTNRYLQISNRNE